MSDAKDDGRQTPPALLTDPYLRLNWPLGDLVHLAERHCTLYAKSTSRPWCTHADI